MSIAELDLSYDGFLAIAASNGSPNADHVYLHSVETYDTTLQDKESVRIV